MTKNLKQLHQEHKELHGEDAVSYSSFVARVSRLGIKQAIQCPKQRIVWKDYNIQDEFMNNFFKKRAGIN